MKRNWVLDSLLILLLAVILIAPLFSLNWLDSWGSIESTFISDARMLKDWSYTPQWQPLWYCGTRWDYIYPPALRYGSAFMANLFHGSTTRGYHVYTAIFYCIGIVGVYWLVRTGSNSRLWAWLTAIAAATISPSYLFIQRVRDDVFGAHTLPHRLNTLVRYGEGPHMTAFALIPIALAMAWKGLRPGQNRWLVGSAFISALIVANNFYGATALAIFFPILCMALWAAYRENVIWIRAAATGLLAFGLCAFWLTPSYIRITLFNMRWVSSAGNSWSVWVGLVAVLLYAGAAIRWGKNRPWKTFALGSALLYTTIVLGHEFFEFRIIGEPGRLIPELDLCIIILVALLAAQIPKRGVAILLYLVFIGVGSYRYLPNAWTVYPEAADHTQRIEYQIQQWMSENMPNTRALVAGSVRFWYDTWHNLPQIGGGSDQGLINPNTVGAQYGMRDGRLDHAVGWAKAFGVGAMISHDKNSQEPYKDWREPRRFDGILPIVFDNKKGDVIYRVDRLHPELARVVDGASLDQVAPIFGSHDFGNLMKYVEVVETGPRLRYHRPSNEEITIQARVEPGQTLVVQESYDPAWRAYVNGQPARIRLDPVQFMRVDVPPGDQEVRLVFERPLENRIGIGLTIVTLVILALLWRRE